MKFFRQNALTLSVAIADTILSVMWVNSLPKIEIPNIDKPVHFVMYACFAAAILLDRRFLQHNKQIGLWYLWASLISIAYGGLMEVVQSFLYWRSCSIYDLIADAIGSAIGTVVVAGVFSICNIKRQEPTDSSML